MSYDTMQPLSSEEEEIRELRLLLNKMLDELQRMMPIYAEKWLLEYGKIEKVGR